jgi:hypothetical protein
MGRNGRSVNSWVGSANLPPSILDLLRTNCGSLRLDSAAIAESARSRLASLLTWPAEIGRSMIRSTPHAPRSRHRNATRQAVRIGAATLSAASGSATCRSAVPFECVPTNDHALGTATSAVIINVSRSRPPEWAPRGRHDQRGVAAPSVTARPARISSAPSPSGRLRGRRPRLSAERKPQRRKQSSELCCHAA